MLNRFYVFAIIGILFFASCVGQPRPIAESATRPATISEKNSLTFYGRASVKIVTASGKVIYVDPNAPGDYSETADYILVTHGHDDHRSISLVNTKPDTVIVSAKYALFDASLAQVMVEGDTRVFGEGADAITIRSVPAYNYNHARTRGVGFIISWEGFSIYHAGDTSKITEMAALTDLGIDYVLLPCDGVYNMGPAEAADCAQIIQPRFVIPIHSSGEGVFSLENSEAVKLPNRVVMKPSETIRLVPKI